MDSQLPPSGEASTSPGSRPKNILLHVLSPAVEVPNSRITFPTVPVSTTIGELKTKIQEAISTKPSPDRQRLIYRGKALVRNEVSLEDIFGREAIETSDALSLHLVLPPTASSYESSTSTSNSIPRQAHLQNIHMPYRPASTGQLPNGPGMRPFTPPNINPGGFGAFPHQHHTPWQPGPNGTSQLPPQMQEALGTHFAALAQQFVGQHMATPGMVRMGGPDLMNGAGMPAFNPMGPSVGHLNQGARQQTPNFPQTAPFHQFLAQQQQARAAARQHGVGDGFASLISSQTPSGSTADIHSSRTTDNAHTRPNGPENTNTIYEGQGPNGSTWRMVINEQRIPIPNNFGNSNEANNNTGSNTGSNTGQSNPIDGRQQSPSSSTTRNIPSEDDPWLRMRERTDAFIQAMFSGGVPSEHETREAESQLNDLRQTHRLRPDPSHDWEIPHFELILGRVYELRRGRGERAALPSLPNPSIATAPAPPQPTESSSPSPIVYLLSSPSGPQALLVSPSGMYTTPGLNVGIVSATVPQSRPHPPTSTAPVIQPPEPANPLNAHAVPPAQPAQPAPPPNEARDLLHILLPLGGHLWLLIRLFGFVYFFTSGAGWRRTILLVICALVVFIAQTGIFRPLQAAIWDPFRRHVEGLVPLGTAGAGGVVRANAVIGANGDANTNGPRLVAGGTEAGRLVPRDVADRLIRENRQNAGVVRRYLQRAERATALFVASLVPGVGERHIAARDAAEAARRAEEREGEERVRAAEVEAEAARMVVEEERGGRRGDREGEGEGEELVERDVFADAVEGVQRVGREGVQGQDRNSVSAEISI